MLTSLQYKYVNKQTRWVRVRRVFKVRNFRTRTLEKSADSDRTSEKLWYKAETETGEQSVQLCTIYFKYEAKTGKKSVKPRLVSSHRCICLDLVPIIKKQLCVFFFLDLKLHLQSTDYGNFLGNVPSPLQVSVIDDKLKEKLVTEFQHMRNHATGPLATFLDFITYR
jgi:hypothetical protein